MKLRYVWLFGLVLLLILAACSSSSETEGAPQVEPGPDATSAIPASEEDDSELTSDQQEAFDQISSEAGFEPELLVDLGLPRFIAPYLTAASDDPESAARDFLETYSGLYGVDNMDQALALVQIQDMDAGTLVRFQQYLEDLPVYAGQAIVSLSPHGLISFANSALQPTVSLSTEAKIDQQQALERAVEYSGDNLAESARDPQLMVFSPQVLALEEAAPSLVWEIGLLVDQGDGGPPSAIQYLVDAVNGEIVFEVPEDFSTENWDLLTAQNSATSDPTPVPLYDKVALWYTMRDGSLTPSLDGNGQPLADAEGMATQANMSTTWEYFFNTHNWDGHDDAGGTCRLTVHVGSGWRNATCGKSCNCLFGDSGGGFGSILDIVAHEFAHAITGQTAGLVYQLESGALSEHYSDFFAAMVDTSDWLLSGPTFFRNLADPPNGSRSSPDHYDELMEVDKPTKDNDNGRVHRNSGIPNKASFMVADTGTNVHPDSGIEVQGLGRDVAEKIWFDTLLSLGPSTGLKWWASSTVGTTYHFVPDLLSQEDACQVQYAMQAVGLREPDCRCDDEDLSDCPIYAGSPGPGGEPDPPGDEDNGDGEETDPEIETTPIPEDPEPIETPEPTDDTMINACDHPYLPVRPGSTWSYADGEGNTSQYTVREVIGDENFARADVDAILIGPEFYLNMTLKWTCDRDGIRAPLTALSGIPGEVNALVYGEEEGVLLPNVENLIFGNQWTYNTLYVMTMIAPNEGGAIQVKNDRQEEYTSEQMSIVSVPAGNFEALEISGVYTVTTELVSFKREFPGTERLWFVEGVGMVKDLVEQDGAYFIELVDYYIPDN
jgi:Zn-dependent metalloprotease